MLSRLGMTICLIASMIGTSLAQGASAPPPSREQAMKLLTILGVEQHLDAKLKQRQSQVLQGARGCFKDMNPAADEATLTRLDAAFAATPTITSADFFDELVADIQQNLSAAEVQAGIDFYGSDEGKGLMQKMPAMMQSMRQSVGQSVEQKLQVYTNAVNRTLMDFQGEMNRSNPPAPHSGGPVASPGAAHTGSI